MGLSLNDLWVDNFSTIIDDPIIANIKIIYLMNPIFLGKDELISNEKIALIINKKYKINKILKS